MRFCVCGSPSEDLSHSKSHDWLFSVRFFPEPFRELKSQDHTVWGVGLTQQEEEEEEEEEEDLFVFNDTIEGPRAPAVKPGRVTQA